jgi:hypothetical protein
VLLVTVLVLLAAFLRLWNVDSAYELFIDEVTYADIASSVAAGDGVRLHGEPFHLHPAAFFGSMAAVMQMLGLQGQPLAELAFGLRPLPALLGAATPALVALVVRRVTGSWWPAASAGLLLVVDPFLIRFDSRVLLEAQAMALAVGALLALLLAQERQDRGARVLPMAVLAGMLGLGSLLTKETYAFVTVLPVLALLVLGRVLSRRTSATVLAVSAAGYLAYVLAVASVGQLGEWFDQKTAGVQRLLGLLQITGFNEEGSPGFLDRVLANLASLLVTYGLIGLGLVATGWLVVMLVRGRPLPDEVSRPGVTLLVVWALCAHAHLGYALTIGTLEEQMFYLLVVTAVPVLAVAVHLLLPVAQWPARPGVLVRIPPRGTAAVVSLAVVGAVVLDGYTWWRLRSVPDDGYAQLLGWAETGLPDGSRVATTEETLQFLLDDTLVVRLETGAEVRDFGADYVLLVEELLEQGYSAADADLYAVTESGSLVHSSWTRTLGRLEVYDVSHVTKPPD